MERDQADRKTVVHVARRARGGMRTHVLALAEGLPPLGYDCRLAGDLAIPGDRLRSFAERGIRAFEVPVPHVPGVALLRSRRSLARLFEECGAHLVHCHGLAAALAVRLAATRSSPPVVVTAHNLPRALGPSPRALLLRFGERRLGRRTARYIAVSRAVRDALVAELGVAPEEVSVIPPGVDGEAFGPVAPAERREARRVLGVPEGRPAVGYLGRLAPEKGPDVLLRAMRELVAASRGVRGSLIATGAGRGPASTAGPDAAPLLLVAGDGPLREGLLRLSRRLGLEGHVRFLGAVPDPRPLLAAVDVLAMPSREEALGLSALEALARGRPVVASDAGGLREAVRDGVDGIRVPAGDVEALAAALGRLLPDEVRRRRMGAAGRERVLREFSLAATLRRTAETYAWVLGESQAAARRTRKRGGGAGMRGGVARRNARGTPRGTPGGTPR